MSGSAPSKTSERKRTGQADSPMQESGQRRAQLGSEADMFALQRVAGNRGIGQLLDTGRSNQTLTNGAPPIVEEVLNEGGQPLDPMIRSSMESRFGYDFSQVRVHTDMKAAESARSVTAHAYSVGSHVVFDTGRYAPHTKNGHQLLAHELTHVVQQQGVRITKPVPIGPTDGVAEREADQISTNMSNPLIRESGPVIQRATKLPSATESTNLVVLTIPKISAQCENFVAKNPEKTNASTGVSVHSELQTWFDRTYGKRADIIFPTGSKAPLKKRIYRFGAEPGKPDLAYLSKKLGIVEIAEVKPANNNGMSDGVEDLYWYLDKGNSDERLKTQHKIDGFVPMEPSGFGLPPFLEVFAPFPVLRRVYFMWCTPGLILYKLDRRNRRKGEEKAIEKVKEKDKDEVTGAEDPKQASEGEEQPINEPQEPGEGDEPLFPPIHLPPPRIPGEIERRRSPGREERPSPGPKKSPGKKPSAWKKPPKRIGPGPKTPPPGGKPIPGREERPSPGSKKSPSKKSPGKKPPPWKKPPRRIGPGPKTPPPGGKPPGRPNVYYQVAVITIAVGLGAKPALASEGGAMTPEEAILQTLLQEGIQVDPEVEKTIRENPELVEKLKEDARRGKLSDAEREAAEVLNQFLKENANDPEAIQWLMEQTAATKDRPSMIATREEMERSLEAIRQGKSPGTGTGEGITEREQEQQPTIEPSGSADLPIDLRERWAGTPDYIKTLYYKVSAGSAKGTFDPNSLRQFLDLLKAYQLTQEQVAELQIDKDATPEQALASLKAVLEELQRQRPPEIALEPTTTSEQIPSEGLQPNITTKEEAGQKLTHQEQEKQRNMVVKILKSGKYSSLKVGFRVVHKGQLKEGESYQVFIVGRRDDNLLTGCYLRIKAVKALVNGGWSIQAEPGSPVFTEDGKFRHYWTTTDAFDVFPQEL